MVSDQEMNDGSQRCHLDMGAIYDVMSIKDKTRPAPEVKLLPNQTELALFSSQTMRSIGMLKTECVMMGKTHKLEFEMVRTRDPYCQAQHRFKAFHHP